MSTLERKTVHVSDATGRIAMLEQRTLGTDPAPKELIRFIYSNSIQSANLELDLTGKIISYEEYHPFGTTSYQATNAQINAVAKRYRYTGKERDEESGLYYHGARYYIPWLCRWTQTDPIGIRDGLNVYAYCSNNPVMMHDPSGMSGEDARQYGARAYVVPVDPDNKKKGNTTLIYHQEGATDENKNKVALLNDKGEVTGVRDMTKEELSADAMSKKIGINEKTGKYTGVQALKSNISGQSPTQEVEKPKETTQLVTESVNPNQTQEGSSSESQKSTFDKTNDVLTTASNVATAISATVDKTAHNARWNNSKVPILVPKSLTFNKDIQYTSKRVSSLISFGRIKGSHAKVAFKLLNPFGIPATKIFTGISIASTAINILKDRKLTIGDVFEASITGLQIGLPALGFTYGLLDYGVSKYRKDGRGITQLIKEDLIDKNTQNVMFKF